MPWLNYLSTPLFLFGCVCFSFAQDHDPYRWLENANCADTQNWLIEQKDKFEKYQQSNPYVREIKATLQNLDDRDFPKSFVRSSDYYLLHQKNGLYIQDGLEGEP